MKHQDKTKHLTKTTAAKMSPYNEKKIKQTQLKKNESPKPTVATQKGISNAYIGITVQLLPTTSVKVVGTFSPCDW